MRKYMLMDSKRRLSFFSHWLIMERSQNWPNLRSPISKFWDIHFIDTLACSNRWKFKDYRLIGVALRNIQTYYEVRSLDVTWWPDLAWPGFEIFTTCAEKMYNKFNPPSGARVKRSMSSKLSANNNIEINKPSDITEWKTLSIIWKGKTPVSPGIPVEFIRCFLLELRHFISRPVKQ